MRPTRRALLRAAGAAIALPLLPSLVRHAQAVEERPVRLLWFYAPNGVRLDRWRPTGEGVGDAWSLGPTLTQLADVKQHLTQITGLRCDAGFGDRPGDHARGTATFLTCTPISFDGVHNGVSADQVAAAKVGHHTPFRSLELGVEGGGNVGTCDSGYSCAYTQNISWAGPTTPMPKITNPRVVFDRLFAGSETGLDAEARARRALYRQSVLDVVRDQAAALQRRVDAEDRARLDEWLTGVRELERRTDQLGSCGPDHDVPASYTLQDHADIMLDLAVAAMRCDLTRFVTFMLANAGSNLVYDFLPGVTGAHHQLSHHQRLPYNLDQLATIDIWVVGRFGRLVRRLAATPDGDGTLLDRTLVMFGSEISDGDRHNHDDLPVLVAGSGGGAVVPDRHLVVRDAPIAELYLAMLQAAGVPVTSFADATRPLPGLAG